MTEEREELTSHRHITLIKMERCFKINTTEDPLTKSFYENTQRRSRSLSGKRLNRKHHVSWSPIQTYFYQTKNSQIDENDKYHLETMQSYENLLETMRRTDQKLEALSRSWVNIPQRRRTIVEKVAPMKKIELISRKTSLQLSILTLILFNFTVVYFFNDIHILWSRYISRSSVSK